MQKSELKLSREFVELIGYGTSTTFYGWIVLKRNYVTSQYKYGRSLRVLATGTVTSSGGVTSIAFDGTTNKITCSHTSGTGIYTLSMPSGWFSSSDNVGVMLTGVGRASGSSSGAPIKATIISRTTTSLVVETSDDATNNDGSFEFMIYNKNDWS